MLHKMTLIVLLLLAGCSSSNYEVGDVSKAYCQSTSVEFREIIKVSLADKGVVLPFDYCSSHGLVDVLLLQQVNRQIRKQKPK